MPYQLFIAADASPWPGNLALYRNPTTNGYALLSSLNRRAITVVLAFDFYAGPAGRFDLGNVAIIDVASGSLFSVTDDQIWAGADAYPIESSAGHWEIFQAGVITLLSP